MTVIAREGVYEVESLSNGGAYVFRCEGCIPLFVQYGDEAAQFRADFDAVMRAVEFGQRTITAKGALAWLWDECGYGAAAKNGST